ncbi:MAG TPA: hypothetical protein VEK07_15665 [Polyangiaceae bacterium]|nr:hypothetical protein [Polyangiaceae bacterium]
MSAVSASARRAAAIALVPTAVATALALVVLRVHFQPPSLSRYVESTGGGDSDGAGGVTLAPVSLQPDGRFEMELRPTAPVRGAVGARGFLLNGDDVRPWDPPLSVSIDGIVRVVGPVERLFAGIPTGTWDVAIAVGRPEFLPTAPNDVVQARDHGREGSGWQLLIKRIRLGGSSSRAP